MKINTLAPDDNEYLKILSGIAKKPDRLHYAGSLPSKRLPTVAIVGTRKPTSYGREVTYRMAYELASKGIIIVSGLALGVDTIAHTAALEAKGRTIAVLGNGLPQIYPATNAQLGMKILDSGGALLSEYDTSERARPYYFLQRNRLVSGLSDAIVITEAAIRSGSINTATHALEQGKDVFVVPGNITSPMSSGCNALIKQGATPLTASDDIAELLLPKQANKQTVLPLGDTMLETQVIQLIHSGVRNGDELQAQCNCTATDLSTALTMLEIKGIIRSLGLNQWTIR